MFSEELKSQLKNVHTYAVTPFKSDDVLQVDRDALAKNIEFLIDSGMQVVAVGGGTGEIEALTTDELESIAETALQVAADRALVITCLSNNLGAAADLARRYEKLGSQICLGMPPLIRGQVPADLEGVFEHYQTLAAVTDLPLMPYNTQNWPAEFFVRLSEIESIIGVKDPCHFPHEFFKAIKLLGDRFVWVGNKRHDPGVLQFRYQMGLEGFTSGQSNFLPAPELEMHAAAQEQNWERIVELQDAVAPLERLRMANDDAAMVKACMDFVGLTGGRVRPPRRDVTDAGRELIQNALEQLDVTDQSASG